MDATLAWVEEFRRRHGRAPRILHVGNIANNAYLAAKILNARGFDCDVVCHDYYHIMGSPEWEEAEFEVEGIDHNNPDWHGAGVHGFVRPRWFVQGPQLLCLDYLLAKRTGRRRRARKLWRALSAFNRTRGNPGNESRLDKLEAHWDRLESALLRAFDSSRGAVDLRTLPELLVGRLRAGALAASNTAITCAAHVRNAWLEALLALRGIASRPDAIEKVRSRVKRLDAPEHAARSCLVNFALLPVALVTAHTLRALGRPIYAVLPAPRGRSEAAAMAFDAGTGFVLETPGMEPDRREVASAPAEPPTPPRRDIPLEWIHEAISCFAQAFPQRQDQLQVEDCTSYRGVIEKWRELFEHYDVIQAYATCVAFPLLARVPHYVGFEHGTLRVFTLDDNATSRLTALGFHQAQHTLITNGDCLEYAQKIGVTRYTPMPHPLDERRYEDVHGDYEGMHRRYGVKYLFFCPVRHDWEVKGTDKYIRALPELVQHLGRDFRIIMTKWGAQVQDSIRLAEELGVADLITFIDPLNRADMTRLQKSVDVVLDQIGLPVFGGISPTALAQGVPVIMSYEPSATEWLFPEPAPILSARSAPEIAAALRTAVDAQWLQEFRVRAADWYGRFHSSDVVARKLATVYREVVEHCGIAGERSGEDWRTN